MERMTFRVLLPRDMQRRERVTLSQPREIAHFSKYADDQVRYDRSNLLRYKEPVIGEDLLDGIDSYTPKDESDPNAHPAPLGPLLDTLTHAKEKITKQPQFVTFRNNLNKILGTPYNTSNPWTLWAEKRHGCVYLDVRRTPDELTRNQSSHINQVRAMYAGRRFELFATEQSSDDASGSRRVNQEEEYCGLFALTLGEKRLIVAAEIDCYDNVDTKTDSYSYVELKTTRTLLTDKDRYVFERFKLLSFWIQSYVVGTPRIVCGFRNDDFKLEKLQVFKTTDIPSFCRKYWEPQVCLSFANGLLQWILDNTAEGQNLQTIGHASPDPKRVVQRSHPTDRLNFPKNMQTVSKLVTVAAIAALMFGDAAAYKPGKVSSGSKSPEKQPGFCKEPEDCKVAGYECVALQTTRSGAEEVKQCVPKKVDTDVCSGQFPGLCPSFASWTDPYKLISSVCTYKPAKKCSKDPGAKSVKGEVICVPGAKDADGEDLDVIYGCVDVDVAAKQLGFTNKEDAGKLAKKLGTADAVIEACVDTNSTTTELLCGGHGTCAPAQATLEYACKCNVGYSGTYCDIKDSNKCALPGQCSAGECNLEKQVCECPAGTTGNQCADCDESSGDACSGNGKCSDKKCVCKAGFLGEHCDQEQQKKKKSSSSSTTSTSALATSGSSAGNTTVTTPSPSAAVGLSISSVASFAVVAVSLLAMN
ncbi:hypothetical protein Poli38472_004024 [Pythium oligandrum]|uniref:Decapping nuclease n=1 Tax=Pythium oligandrum TaxID=41045 RepID=A0A8K1CNB8_PYTOL|nr:hypothetical protein Poli38472_004024 [Pythium oligandrum]|eukprot:TMW66259.1 hypothetical protein Poli38472_004024 [Pythium oligandrum]